MQLRSGKIVDCDLTNNQEFATTIQDYLTYCNDCCGDAFACQHVLQRFINDPKNNSSDVLSALIIVVWMRIHDLSVELVVLQSSWAANFLLDCFTNYSPENSFGSELQVGYGNALYTLSNALN
jgi:hypothetical protein